MNEKIKKMLVSRGVQYLLLVFGIITIIMPIIGSLIKSGVDCDSAYYICMAERILDGYIPYKTLALGYTPLFIYLMAGLKWLFCIPSGCYWPYLFFHYILEIGVAFFVYAIARNFGSNRNIALFGGWLSIMMIHWLSGNCVLLEVPSLFFGLASSWCILKFKNKNIWHLLWIGGLTTCSFLCKQFGLGFIGINLYILVAINHKSWKECAIFLIGFAFPIVLCYMCFGNVFTNVIFSGYGTKSAAEAGRDVSVINKLNSVISGMFYFCYMVCAAVFVGVLSFPKAFKNGHFWKLLLGYCGIIGFSLQFIFAGGLHYMMYMVPFACLVVTEMLTIRDSRWLQLIKYISIIFVIMVTLYKVYNNRVYKQYIKGNERTQQQMLTEKVKEYVKPHETLWIVHGGIYYLLFTADVLPPNVGTIGYSFGPLGLNEEEAFCQAKEADWVIRFSKDYPYESFFTDSLKHYVEQYPAISFGDSAILLHKMH